MSSGPKNATLLLVVAVAVAAALVGVVIGGMGHERITTLVERLTHGDPHEAGEAGAAGKQLWTCSMHPQVIRDKPGLCPICHMQLTPLATPGSQPTTTATSATAESPGQRKVKYWWDPM